MPTQGPPQRRCRLGMMEADGKNSVAEMAETKKEAKVDKDADALPLLPPLPHVGLAEANQKAVKNTDLLPLPLPHVGMAEGKKDALTLPLPHVRQGRGGQGG